MNYPADVPDVINLGNRHFALLHPNGASVAFLWWHDCSIQRTWSWIGEMGSVNSGHAIECLEPLHVEGSLLCPRGCGEHGYIHGGTWVAA